MTSKTLGQFAAAFLIAPRVLRTPIPAALLLALFCTTSALAQAPTPPTQPLGPPAIPTGNPQTAAKIALGKALFWEEQLSVTGTVACGSCHRPVWGGADPRSELAGSSSRNPGVDGIFATADDVQGSAGVPAHTADGHYQPSPIFGFAPQVGGRKSPSAVNAAYASLLFWDGRAGTRFNDPLTGQVLIAQGGALENQALGPLVDTHEMAPAGAQVNDIGERLSRVQPLALASDIPHRLRTWIGERDYPALFTEVFGSAELSAARIAMAIASYERTLNATQTPLDRELGGISALTDLERQGRQVFITTDCAGCHAGTLLSDNDFHYIGLRPTSEDPGRFAQSNNPDERGAFRTPSLRSVELRTPYMHNGRLATLEDVVEFYNRGGDFDAPNKDPRIRPRDLSAAQKAALLAFLRRPLTDPRVAAELAPFDRPTLYTESGRAPAIVGSGTSGSGGFQPQMRALEPPLLGNRSFTVALSQALGGAAATLVVGHDDPGVQGTIPVGDFAETVTVLQGTGAGAGYASVHVDLGENPDLIGQTLYGRFYVADPQAPNALAISPAFRITVFGEVIEPRGDRRRPHARK